MFSIEHERPLREIYLIDAFIDHHLCKIGVVWKNYHWSTNWMRTQNTLLTILFSSIKLVITNEIPECQLGNKSFFKKKKRI